MNRAERRRAGIKVKPTTRVLTEDQIQQIKNDAVTEAFTMLLSIPNLVLHDKFCFGKIQLDRFNYYALSWAKSVQTGEVTLKEVLDLCKNEAGVTIKEK